MHEDIMEAAQAALLDSSINSNLALMPKLISNDYKNGKKVLATIEDALQNCDEFMMSVAFISDGGLEPLLQIFDELNERGIKGKILTTNYKEFTSPRVLDTLSSLDNIEVSLFYVHENKPGFHTKGYLFKKDDLYKIIVGSSNMTLWALTQNKEWNMELVSTKHGDLAQNVVKEFNELWNEADPLDKWLETYRKIYEEKKKIIKQEKVVSIEQKRLEPNRMQLCFINKLQDIIREGKNKALLISATGTGKTYASAFAVQDMKPKRMLFIVHRELIAKQAMKSYQNVLGFSKSYGLISGNEVDINKDFIFATMQMMAKENIQELFKPEDFDVIVIDESHHAGANSYQKIMEYFNPKFWLGMTASPDTSQYDIYSIFDHNIAYEIRLQQALEYDLLCPFHYFGITELEIDGEIFDDNSSVRSFNRLVCDKRVDYIIEKAKYYGFSGERVKGLVFCSGIKEAEELSNKFNERGYRTAFLGGKHNEEQREEYIDRLTNDNRIDNLDYIFTVGIFNEGVDIPEVNQVIMLRPTESPVVFIQQLGRGLRKSDGKEYVVIIDFIGNYMNNFMIPIALSGDRTYNKDTIRKYVTNGSRVIPGSSTIHFDRISKERIYKSIDQIKGIKSIIKDSYFALKYKLGRVPYLMDFYENGEVDPLLILDNFKTYYNFLKNVEKDYTFSELSTGEIVMLEYLSKLIASGKRPYELEILQAIISEELVDKSKIKAVIEEKYHKKVNTRSIDIAFDNLQGKFVNKEDELVKYSQINIVESTEDGIYRRMQAFQESRKKKEISAFVNDLIQLGLRRYHDLYAKSANKRGEFILYEKYSRRDVCYLLDWGKDLSSTMFGMKRVGDNVAIFVTYNKEEASEEQEYIDGKPDYADEFVNEEIFMWDSQIGKGPNSSYMKDVQEAKYKHLFVKKSDAEGTDFYYMGQFDIISVETGQKRNNNGQMKDIAKVQCRMHDIVRSDLLDYLQKNERISG